MVRRRITELEKRIMQDIALNLKLILNKRGMSQKQLSELTGLSTSAISDYMNAKTLMAPNIIQLISESLGIKAREISTSLEGVDSSELEFSRVPIIGKISCGGGIIVYEEIEGYELTPKEWLNGGEHFYLRAKGDSMNGARIFENDLLLIRKQSKVENGEIAVVLIGEDAVLKRVYRNGEQIVLQSENPSYPPIFCASMDVSILGKLKKIVISV